MLPLPAAARRWWPAAAGVTVLAVALLVPLSGGGEQSPRAAQAASSPAPVAPAASAIPAVDVREVPAAGTASLAAGPFSDRLAATELTLARGEKASVTGQFRQVTENSALLVMEVQADFYDAGGELLGSRRKVLRQPDVVTGGVLPDGSDTRYGGDIGFAVSAPAEWAGEVASALVSVPVLVNE